MICKIKKSGTLTYYHQRHDNDREKERPSGGLHGLGP